MRLGSYSEGPARCRVELCQMVSAELRPKLREVSGLLCDAASRGKGHAKALMARLIATADDHGLTLLVVVEPFEGGPMDKAALRDWYARLGFRVIQGEPCVMARAPKALNG